MPVTVGRTKVFDSTEVIAIFAGILLNSGRAESSFLKLTPQSGTFQSSVSSDGEVTRWKTNDPRVNIEVQLVQTSDVNDSLSTIHTTDKNSPNGAGISPFRINDRSGRTQLSCSEAWIVGPPEVTYSKGVETRTWKFEGKLDKEFVAGN
jgi:hypothetical protein